MKKVYRKENLGQANYGWLDTHYHFSFANYFNPARMGFGPLRVINDDVIAPKSGFELHPHRDMKIISYVQQGAITHKDSAGNQGRTVAGDLQVITAGSGIFHSEYNLENELTHMFQIWIRPRKKGLQPSWSQAQFNHQDNKRIQLLVAGDGSAPLTIHQDVKIYLGKLDAGSQIVQPIKDNAYLVMLEGALSIEAQNLYAGDGLQIEQESGLNLQANTQSEFLLIELGA